jgi:hypothetical protein
MKNLLTIVIILSVALRYSSAQNYHEVYDFNVDDVFQYLTSKGCGSGDSPSYETIKKYKIVSKEVSGDTIKYSIIGKELMHEYYWETPNWVEYSSSSSDIDAILTYIDSANDYLNKPTGSLVLLTPPYSQDSVLSRILVDSLDGMKMKIVGGDVYQEITNLFEYHADTTILDTINFEHRIFTTIYELKYSKNLGLVEYNYQGFECGEETTLQGYVKGNNTTGIVWPDSKFIVSSSVIQNKIKITPNPANDYLYIDVATTENLAGIAIYDLNGREIISFSPAQKLYVGSLFKGVYVIRFIDKTGLFSTEKLIKE